MPDAREVVVTVDVPAGVRVDGHLGERAAGQSGGILRIYSVGHSTEEAEAQIQDFAKAVAAAAK